MSFSPRFKTNPIQIGNLSIGGEHPIAVQSMTTTDTMDIESTVEQVKALVNVGCNIVRITAPTVQDAEALRTIRDRLRSDGVNVPLVADIHFLPAAAMIVADYVEKVRINPGNYADRKMFKTRDYSDSEYQEELERIHEKFKPLVFKLKDLNRALRIGTNHGSLSDRIMNRFGDTPEGMVESAFEFAEICRRYDFHNFCFSMKASNVGVMIRAYRLLVERQKQKGWAYPIHLGVTEAGDGEDGRIKSAIGIGTLLNEGIGDTIRVSLTEASVKEIPVAEALARRFPRNAKAFDSGFSMADQPTIVKAEPPEVWMRANSLEDLKNSLATTNLRPDVVYFTQAGELANEAHMLPLQMRTIFGSTPVKIAFNREDISWKDERVLRAVLPLCSLFVSTGLAGEFQGKPVMQLVSGLAKLKATKGIDPQSIILSSETTASDELERILDLSLDAGAAFADICFKGILLESSTAEESLRLSFSILQATRRRMSKTEYISCPSCGRTLFDLEETTARIKSVTSHLKGVKIAVMGCIVNGPGEMADADFGYVGGAPGRVNLYVGKDCVERNIASAEAPNRLVDLIKKNDRWVEPSLSNPDRSLSLGQ